MSEVEWLTCGDPDTLLTFSTPRMTSRIVRLFVWNVDRSCSECHAVDQISLRALGVGTQWLSDGGDGAVAPLIPDADAWNLHNLPLNNLALAACSGLTPPSEADVSLVRFAMAALARIGIWTKPNLDLKRFNSEYCRILRDLVPFRPVSFDAEWRTSTATAIAQQMYESRDFGAMPILADALQDAGCDNDDILNHCRGDGPHVRGCWVVDLVLGKE